MPSRRDVVVAKTTAWAFRLMAVLALVLCVLGIVDGNIGDVVKFAVATVMMWALSYLPEGRLRK